MLSNKSQVLDMWSGKISSRFSYKGSSVDVETWADPDSDTVAVSVESSLLKTGDLVFFFDFPYPTHDKFNAPYVGVYNLTSLHSTRLEAGKNSARIQHDMGGTIYSLYLTWDGEGKATGPADGSHKYILTVPGSSAVRLTATFSLDEGSKTPTYEDVSQRSEKWWPSYWSSGAFIDLTAVPSANATELQRRTIQSQYLLAINSASSLPPQGKRDPPFARTAI
jgi:hypothetical protein